MNKRMHNIDQGKGFIQVLLLRQVRHDIEAKTSDEISESLRENLLSKWEEGNIFPDHDTQIKLLKRLHASPESLFDLINELHSIKERIDFEENIATLQPHAPVRLDKASNSGSYFFITAVIALLDLYIQTVKEEKADKAFLKTLYPLIESAKRFSKELRIKPPNITESTLMHHNIETTQHSLQRWTSLLIQSAIRQPICENRPKLVFRGLLKGIPYVGHAIDALIFGKEKEMS